MSNKEPDRVTHDTERVIPFLPDVMDKTTIHKGNETYTGYGWTEEEANKSAGEKYSKGEKDEK